MLILFSDANVLRVLNLNTWGLGWPISSDRVARFRALREVIAHSDYDVILLQEVWYRSDHELLRTALPYSTYFGIFNSGCSGYLLPLGCSGLTILSRYPFVDVEFTPFNERGSFWSFDGEIFVQKGLGRARIIWGPEKVAIDLFTTHLVSYTNNPNRDNNRIRYMQTLEVIVKKFVKKIFKKNFKKEMSKNSSKKILWISVPIITTGIITGSDTCRH